MSGYVLLVLPNFKLPKLSSIFLDDEANYVPLGNDKILVYVTNSGEINGGTIFQGYGIDYAHESVVFAGASPEDVPRSTRPVEGSYFTAQFSDEWVHCGADLFGHVSMAWFETPDIFAVSDSLHTLVALRRVLGLPINIDETTVKARSWLNSMAFSQLGPQTYCEEIRYATPGTSFIVNVASGKVEEAPLKLGEYYAQTFDSHAQAIEMAAERMVRTFKTYAETGGLASLALSGGHDSRLCLAAGLAADIGSSLNVACNNNGTIDYPIAVELSEEFNFLLNKPRKEIQGRLVSNDVFAGWAAGSLGLYDQLYMPAKFRVLDQPVFVIGGQGAGTSKGNFGWRPLANISMPVEALEQCRGAIERLGIDPEDRWGSEWHYLGYRSALHSGRAILSTEYIARPTAQSPLIGLSRSNQNELATQGSGEVNVIVDTLIKLNPSLATHRFDKPGKSFSELTIADRLNKLGGPLDTDELEPYRIVGKPRPSKGILVSHLDIARNAGFTGDLNALTMVPFATKALETVHDVVSLESRNLFNSIDPTGDVRIKGASREAGVLGQLVAISALL